MREEERIDRILSKIGKVWKGTPDLRFFQLVSLLQSSYSKQHDGYGSGQTSEGSEAEGISDFFYLEDDELEQFLDEWERDEQS